MNGTKDRKVKPDFAQYGFAHQENLIMACIGGSQAHGAKLGATDDTDWYGLYIPPPTKLLGLEREDHFVFTSDRKSTRLNSSHQIISYAVFCLKKKKKEN